MRMRRWATMTGLGTMTLWMMVATILMPMPSPSTVQAADDDTAGALGARLMPLIKAHKGEVAVAVKHLDTGETFVYRQDVPMPTASLIKFPVMIETYRQSEAGEVDLNKMLTLKKEDRVAGSGILTPHFTDGATFSLRDAVRMMIFTSDNTATNMVLDQIGIGSTAAFMEKLGFPETKIHSKTYHRETSVFPERSVKYGLGSTTAADMVALFEKLHKKELVSPAASEAMLVHLRTCDDRDKFPKFLPHGTPLAFKTGSVDESRTCAGIMTTRSGPVALCVLTSKNEDKRWVPENAGNVLCAEVAREVFDHFQPKPAADAPASR
ncbi:serine hydrolase [Isosphaeraceae bacterium EP7]